MSGVSCFNDTSEASGWYSGLGCHPYKIYSNVCPQIEFIQLSLSLSLAFTFRQFFAVNQRFSNRDRFSGTHTFQGYYYHLGFLLGIKLFWKNSRTYRNYPILFCFVERDRNASDFENMFCIISNRDPNAIKSNIYLDGMQCCSARPWGAWA